MRQTRSAAKRLGMGLLGICGLGGLTLFAVNVNVIFGSFTGKPADPLDVSHRSGQRPSGFYLYVDIANTESALCFFTGEFKLVPKPDRFYIQPRILQRAGHVDDTGVFRIHVPTTDPGLEPGGKMCIEFQSDSLPLAIDHVENLRSHFKVLISHDFGWGVKRSVIGESDSINLAGLGFSGAILILAALVIAVIRYPWLGIGARKRDG